MPVGLESDRNDFCGSLEAVGARGRKGCEVHGRAESRLRETVGDVASHSPHLTCRNQRNDAATEAAARHPGTKGSSGGFFMNGTP